MSCTADFTTDFIADFTTDFIADFTTDFTTAAMDNAERHHLARQVRELHVPSNTLVIRQGAVANDFFVIYSGSSLSGSLMCSFARESWSARIARWDERVGADGRWTYSELERTYSAFGGLQHVE